MGLKYLYVPSGVKAGTAYGVLPNSADADFDDFTRNSAGSRVDKNGLINTGLGLGSEEITNGDFEQGSTDWSISNTGSASSSISNGYLRIVTNGDYTIVVQGGLAIGKTYKLSYTILESDGGSLVFENPSQVDLDSSVGDHTIEFYSGVTSLRLKRGGGALDVKIDNVSVREITDANINVPRLDYTGGGCPSLLLEPQSINYLTYSEDFTQSYWSKQGTSSITSNTTISPDGSLNADTLSGATGTSVSGSVLRVNVGLSVESTLSIYCKSLGSTNLTIYIRDGANGSVGSESILLTDEWQRVVLTKDPNNGQVFFGNTNGDVAIYGAQIENQSYETSYIPTFGATSTRSQDVAANTGDISSDINSQEGTFMFEAKYFDSVLNRISLNSSTSTSQNRITVYADNNRFQFLWRIDNVGNQVNFVTSDLYENSKIAIKWKNASIIGYLNGVEVFNRTDINEFSTGALDRITLGVSTESAYFKGRVKQLRIYDEYLSDAEMVKLTTL
jgi:hypothetical protein